MRWHTPSKAERWPAAVFYNILDLAGINVRILLKGHQQQESLEESPAAAADADTEAVPIQRAANRTKPRTLEMPQSRVW